ncbi:MAG: transporter [Phycisphaerae bacterium]
MPRTALGSWGCGPILLVAGFAAALVPGPVLAGPIISDVALTPHEGGSIFRLQYGYSEADGRGAVEHVNASSVRGIYVFGLRQNLAVFLSVPYANRQVDKLLPKMGRFEEAHDGMGDLTLMAKYRFWQHDPRPLETARWAALGGIEIRSGDSDFSSDSYDPIVGTVFTWRHDRHLLDADLIYKLNTGGGRDRHDMLRYDLAYSLRLFPAAIEDVGMYEWNAVAELNGRYMTDGSHEVFLTPGLQLVTEQWVLELALQLPVIQDLPPDDPETRYRLVMGIRFQW